MRINSVNPACGGPEGGEAAVIAWVAEAVRGLGIEPTTWDAVPGRPNLTALLPGRDPSRVTLFFTHCDTVSIAGMIDPFAGNLEGGRLWGRGSTDAKGQLVAMLHAFAAVALAPEPPPTSILFAVTIDEEAGFRGVKNLVARGLDVEAAVVGEPTGLEVVVAHKGTQRVWIEIRGRAAHSAKPRLGVNSIHHAAMIVRRIQEGLFSELQTRAHPLLGSPTINVSMINGGTQVNLVPERTRILIDRRTLPGETRESVAAEIEAILDDLRRTVPGFDAVQEPALMVDPPLETAPDHPLALAAMAVSRSMSRPDKPAGAPYGTDGSKLGEAGIPTIIVGPGSIDQAHTADEYIDVSELVAGALYYHALMRAERPR